MAVESHDLGGQPPTWTSPAGHQGACAAQLHQGLGSRRGAGSICPARWEAGLQPQGCPGLLLATDPSSHSHRARPRVSAASRGGGTGEPPPWQTSEATLGPDIWATLPHARMLTQQALYLWVPWALVRVLRPEEEEARDPGHGAGGPISTDCPEHLASYQTWKWHWPLFKGGVPFSLVTPIIAPSPASHTVCLAGPTQGRSGASQHPSIVCPGLS